MILTTGAFISACIQVACRLMRPRLEGQKGRVGLRQPLAIRQLLLATRHQIRLLGHDLRQMQKLALARPWALVRCLAQVR